jgi:hypothetical protein
MMPPTGTLSLSQNRVYQLAPSSARRQRASIFNSRSSRRKTAGPLNGPIGGKSLTNDPGNDALASLYARSGRQAPSTGTDKGGASRLGAWTPTGRRMLCAWRCGARLAASQMRTHFTKCSRREIRQHARQPLGNSARATVAYLRRPGLKAKKCARGTRGDARRCRARQIGQRRDGNFCPRPRP